MRVATALITLLAAAREGAAYNVAAPRPHPPSPHEIWQRDLATSTRYAPAPRPYSPSAATTFRPLGASRLSLGFSPLKGRSKAEPAGRRPYTYSPPPPPTRLTSPRAPPHPYRSHLPDEERLQAFHALKLAIRVHEGQQRRDGQPFVTHPVAVARLVASWGMDGDSVVAALLHDAVEDTPLTFSEVEQCFGAEVRTLVQGVTRVSKLDAHKLEEIEAIERIRAATVIDPQQTEGTSLSSFDSSSISDLAEPPAASSEAGEEAAVAAATARGAACDDMLPLLHACAGDWRVAVLKVADRLHNMRTLDAMAPRKRARKAQETERVFVPLAHYLGAHDVGSELARLSAIHRADDQPQHRVWASRLASAVLNAQSSAIQQAMASTRWLPRHLPFGVPFEAQGSPRSESNFFRLVLQLSESEPARARHLALSLSPLHERLARHQAVMMSSGEMGDEEADGERSKISRRRRRKRGEAL